MWLYSRVQRGLPPFPLRKQPKPMVPNTSRPLLSGLPTLPGGGGGAFCHFWVGLVGPLFKISFVPTRKVFKILGGWVSEISPASLPLVSKTLNTRCAV